MEPAAAHPSAAGPPRGCCQVGAVRPSRGQQHHREVPPADGVRLDASSSFYRASRSRAITRLALRLHTIHVATLKRNVPGCLTACGRRRTRRLTCAFVVGQRRPPTTVLDLVADLLRTEIAAGHPRGQPPPLPWAEKMPAEAADGRALRVPTGWASRPTFRARPGRLKAAKGAAVLELHSVDSREYIRRRAPDRTAPSHGATDGT